MRCLNVVFCCLTVMLLSCTPRPIVQELLPPQDFYVVDTVSMQRWPLHNASAFPEREYPRFNKPLGVCISGGAGRAFGASIGQITALKELGVFDSIAIVSVLSGSSWSSVPWWFAPRSFRDEILRGPATTTPPESLTPRLLERADSGSLAYAFSKLTDLNLLERISMLERTKKCPDNRLYSHALGDLLLNPYGLFSYNSFIACDSLLVASIRRRNPVVDTAHFVTMRSGVPLLVVNAALINANLRAKSAWPFEFSPIACGTPVPYPAVSASGDVWYGKGYVETFGFNASDPTTGSDSQSLVGTLERSNRFLFADMIGSSGAAPASIAAHLHLQNWFPQFTVNAVDSPSPEKSALFSMGDGGDIDDAGILSLLARGQKKILAFVNAENPLGSTSDRCHSGVDDMVSRLFGHLAPTQPVNDMPAPVFEDNGAFDALVNGLMKAKTLGGNTVPWYRGEYRILQPNAFGIPPMPGDGTVEILWVYNDCNAVWRESLPADIQSLFTNENNCLRNFPNLKTVFNDKKQMFYYSPLQINLLANMWYCSMKPGTTLGEEIVSFSK